jgi:hypothetical protein
MKKLIWRIKFALAVRRIFSEPKGAFTGNHLKLGWKMSADQWKQRRHLEPFDAALKEIGEWYDI